jgi:hypothetical protein
MDVILPSHLTLPRKPIEYHDVVWNKDGVARARMQRVGSLCVCRHRLCRPPPPRHPDRHCRVTVVRGEQEQE